MSGALRDRLSRNLQHVRERVDLACTRIGRRIGDVTLVAVTKYAELESVRELVALGVTDFGEARPQQLVLRSQQWITGVHWHLIGHLQRNKAELVIGVAELIHSVDSVRLFEHLAKLAMASALIPKILLEVNVSGETSKDGFDENGLLAAWPQLRACESLQIEGLMTMAPIDQGGEIARTVFRRLRKLRDRLVAESDGRFPLKELSMGMSGDFEIAIEEGATIIRIGSSLFAEAIQTA